MLKKIGVLVFVMLLLPLALAVEFDVKDNYAQGETLITKLSGNFLTSVSEDNVFFYRRHMKVPMDFGIFNIEDEFYIYALLPENEDNYSISIEDAEYYVGSKISDENIVREFLISNESAIFSVNPGVVSSDETFSIEVQNLQEDKIIISYKSFVGFEGEEVKDEVSGGFWASLFGGGDKEEIIEEGKTIELKSGEKQNIDFKVGNITKSSLNTILLSSEGLDYNIPVYLIKNYDEVNVTVEDELVCCEIYGYGVEMEKVDINYEFLKESECSVPEDFVGGNKEIVSDEFCEEIIIEEDVVVVEEEDGKTCAEMNGTKCGKREECDGSSVDADDGECCLGGCVEKEGSSFMKILGWILVVLVLGFLIWFFKFRYRGAKRKVDLMDVAKKGAGKGVQ